MRHELLILPCFAKLRFAACFLLGKAGSAEAIPAITAVLGDPKAEGDALIAAVRALGRIGDAQAIQPIEALLEKEDLPLTRTFQVSVAAVTPATEDTRWQLDLAAASVLNTLGKKRMDLVSKHKDDPRAHVRRYAGKVEGELACISREM